MTPISDILFNKKITTINAYKKFIKSNNIKLPNNIRDKRKNFINWYLENHKCDIETNIADLSNYYLYISQRTIEDLIFKNEKK